MLCYPVYAIIGGCIGGALLLFVLAVIIAAIVSRRKRQYESPLCSFTTHSLRLKAYEIINLILHFIVFFKNK